VPDPEPVAGRDPSSAEWERVRASRRMREYVQVMPKHAFFIGPTAALIWKAPLPEGLLDELHVAVLHPRTPVRRPGVRGIQVRSKLVTVKDGDAARYTNPATTWASLGSYLEVDDLVAVADHLIRVPRIPGTSRIERKPYAQLSDLAAALSTGRRVGGAKLREAYELARIGAASRPETQLRLILVRGGLPEPELNADVYDDHGRFIGCGDLVYRERKVAVEYEGDGHRKRDQFETDIERFQRYAEAGWVTVRLTSAHVPGKPDECVRRVREALERSTVR
jgi:hypothetical protein